MSRGDLAAIADSNYMQAKVICFPIAIRLRTMNFRVLIRAFPIGVVSGGMCKLLRFCPANDACWLHMWQPSSMSRAR
jgi:hypothetical protein